MNTCKELEGVAGLMQRAEELFARRYYLGAEWQLSQGCELAERTIQNCTELYDQPAKTGTDYCSADPRIIIEARRAQAQLLQLMAWCSVAQGKLELSLDVFDHAGQNACNGDDEELQNEIADCQTLVETDIQWRNRLMSLRKRCRHLTDRRRFDRANALCEKSLNRARHRFGGEDGHWYAAAILSVNASVTISRAAVAAADGEAEIANSLVCEARNMLARAQRLIARWPVRAATLAGEIRNLQQMCDSYRYGETDRPE